MFMMLSSCVAEKDGLHISWNSASMPAQQDDVFWCSDSLLTDNMLLTVNHAPKPFKLVSCLLIADLLGAFLHSNFIPES
jgi:hypothetical protein